MDNAERLIQPRGSIRCKKESMQIYTNEIIRGTWEGDAKGEF